MSIDLRDVRVLQLIHQGKSMQEIADDVSINRSKAWTQIACKKLEDRGYVTNPFKRNRYAKGVKRTLTRKGLSVLVREGLLQEDNGQH